tara:strand:+ start:3576 stop:4763 length:1188 start_codon:yes stop_codon:yes gene_type:complete
MKGITVFIAILLSAVQMIGQEDPAPNYDLKWTFDLDHYGPNDYEYFTPVSESGGINLNLRAVTRNLSADDAVQDRHGDLNKAIKMRDDSKIDFSYNDQKYFGLAPEYIANADVDAITISMWVKFIDQSSNERLILGAKENASDSHFKFGLSLKGTALYLKRYFENKDGSTGVGWDYECFQPGAFDSGYGWYYIALTFAKTQKYMRLLLGKPNGGATYGPGTDSNVPGSVTVTREFDGRLIWIPGIREGHQHFNYWTIENAGNLSFDDIKIWKQDLTLEQSKTLFYKEKPADKGAKIANKKKVPEVPEDDFQDYIRVVPNPNKGNFNIDVSLELDSNIHISLFDLQGRQVYHETKKLSSGRHSIHVKAEQLSTGLYFLNLKNNNKILLSGYKIIID